MPIGGSPDIITDSARGQVADFGVGNYAYVSGTNTELLSFPRGVGICAWINWTNMNAVQTIICKGEPDNPNYALEITEEGGLRFRTDNAIFEELPITYIDEYVWTNEWTNAVGIVTNVVIETEIWTNTVSVIEEGLWTHIGLSAHSKRDIDLYVNGDAVKMWENITNVFTATNSVPYIGCNSSQQNLNWQLRPVLL